MGDKKNHTWRRSKDPQHSGASRRRTPLDSDTDMLGAPSLWCKRKKTHHHSDEGHRSRRGIGVDEQPRQKHRSFYSPFHRFWGIGTGSKHRHRKTTTPTREPRVGRGCGFGYSTSPPPPPPPPLKRSSPYTPPRYLHTQSGMGMTPSPRPFRRRPCRTPVSPVQDSPGFNASCSGTPSTASASSTSRPPSNPLLNPSCDSCFKTHHLNASLRESLLVHTRELYTLLQNWSDEAGTGDGMTTPIDPMEWQPEKAAVIEKERRPSEMCRVLMKMGSVEDWVRIMRALEEKEGGGGGLEGQKMEGVKEGLGRDEEHMRDGEEGEEDRGLGGLGGEYCLRYRRMAVDEGGGMG
ncbi:hypothetical protein QBC32DRAFT_209018 [Pseudoneurospora amorphoporcata]|uniref:Uncharacterized protein n=1 Tax=Pseudoneurospora amorphoporcata TaxID=241081 RepID=A0AAN6SHU3_9PEZI|nr:hypothetical protein QBC32DRAFT_209018 [Pseudoneurospora amorphoporcata]